MATSQKQVQRYSDTRMSPIKISHINNFEFINFNKQPEHEILSRRNPTNSFYAQKFKKFQNRPHSSAPYSVKKSPMSSPIHEEPKYGGGLIGSFFVNARPTPKRVATNLATYHAELMRRNASQSDGVELYDKSRNLNLNLRNNRKSKQKTQILNKKGGDGVLCLQIMNQMNQNMSLIKFSSQKKHEQKTCEKRYINSECKNREVEICEANPTNLNIKGLTTNPIRFNNARRKTKDSQESTLRQQSSEIFHKLITEQMALNISPQRTAPVQKSSSTFEKQQSKKTPKSKQLPILSWSQKQYKQPRSPTKKYKPPTPIDYFGRIKESTCLEQLQRLRAMYYRDLIWKVWFNSDWKVKIQAYGVGSADSPRFFVGKGNNSKLVRALMGRRWWWKIDTKEDNANFLWTQLKIYSAYQNQIGYEKVTIFEEIDSIIEKQKGTEQIAIDENEPAGLQNEQSECIQNSTQTNTNSNTNTDSNTNINTNLKINKNINMSTKTEPINEKMEICQSIKHNYLDWWNQKTQLKDKNTFLLTQRKYNKWATYIKNCQHAKRELKTNQTLQSRRQLEKQMKIHYKYPQKVTNHLQFSRLIGNKKALYKTMSIYYQLSKKSTRFLPKTYHIQSGLEDKEYLKFLSQYFRRSKEQKNSMWIVKPGEMSNRGCGITVCDDIQQIKKILKNRKTHTNGKPFTYILQQYIRQPFLYQGRKFDIRHYIMINSTFGRVKGYFYEQGYIRTTSYKYSIKNQDPLVHLTNDAVQKYCKDYGKYQKGNKVSYEEFQKYLKQLPQAKEKQYSFYDKILPRIREISMDIINASYYIIDPKRNGNNFQIFGLDIMIDSDFRPWLIEVNTNPCLELSSPVLSKVIPRMLDNAFAISLDPLFPPPADICLASKKNNLPENFVAENRFELVFDEKTDGNRLNRIYEEVKEQLEQMEGYGSDEEAYESAQDDCSADY